jgi:hypothetical protein
VAAATLAGAAGPGGAAPRTPSPSPGATCPVCCATDVAYGALQVVRVTHAPRLHKGDSAWSDQTWQPKQAWAVGWRERHHPCNGSRARDCRPRLTLSSARVGGKHATGVQRPSALHEMAGRSNPPEPGVGRGQSFYWGWCWAATATGAVCWPIAHGMGSPTDKVVLNGPKAQSKGWQRRLRAQKTFKVRGWGCPPAAKHCCRGRAAANARSAGQGQCAAPLPKQPRTAKDRRAGRRVAC